MVFLPRQYLILVDCTKCLVCITTYLQPFQGILSFPFPNMTAPTRAEHLLRLLVAVVWLFHFPFSTFLLEWPFCSKCLIHYPIVIVFNNKDSAFVVQIKPAEYVEILSSMNPDVWVTLADEVPAWVSNKRNRTSVDRTLRWLDDCISLNKVITLLCFQYW